jgi:hypothetical protein
VELTVPIDLPQVMIVSPVSSESIRMHVPGFIRFRRVTGSVTCTFGP